MPEPDYKRLRQLLESAFDALNCEFDEDDPFQWKLKKKLLNLLVAVQQAEKRKSRKKPRP